MELPGEFPLFGTAVTLNSLTDFQWYLLALVALVPAGVVWLRDIHVRVDFAYASLSPRGKTIVNIAGHIIFALPLLIYMIPDAWELAAKAFARGEGSANGGLIDRYLPRAAIPLGLGLLLLAIFFEIWCAIRNWRQKDV